MVRTLQADRPRAGRPRHRIGRKVTVAKLNIDENPKTPGQFGVRGIPTLMLFKDGKVAATKIGALPKGALFQWVESVL